MARSYLPDNIKRYVPAAIAVVLTAIFLFLGLSRLDLVDTSFLTRVEFLWLDQKFRLRNYQPPGNEVVMVGIDDKTLDRYGSFRVFQRDKFATLIDNISAAKPKVIGFDITFQDVTNAENDQKFADAVQRAGNVVMGVYLQLRSNTAERREATELTPDLINLVVDKEVFPAELAGPTGQTQPKKPNEIQNQRLDDIIQGKDLQLAIPELLKACASFGFVNFHRDIEGSLRYQPQFIEYQGRLWPSLDIQLARRYLDALSPIVEIVDHNISQVQIGSYRLQTDKFGRYMLNFDGPSGWHQMVSMVDVMDGKVPADTFKNKIVVIGSPAVGLSDIVTSPYDPQLPAMELHANVIENFIHQNFIYRTGTAKIVDVLLIIFFGVVLGLYLPKLNASRSVFYTVLLLVTFTTLNILSFLMLRWVLSFVYPGLALVVTSGSMISYKYFTEEREKKRTRSTFQYYLDRHVIEQVMNQPELLKLGGEKRDLTVLFSDIRGFTSFSEKMAPAEVVQFLNQYFDKMTGVIFKHKGTLDKLIGDAVMCFWGHPIETKDHAVRGVITALEMIQGVEDLRGVLVLPGGAKFEIGIGLNTGPMVVGNMGSQSRFSYTVMGDNVNLGSRLESLNKYYGTRIIISDSTFDAVKDMVHCRQLDTIQVKGKSQSVTIYEPIGMKRLEFERRKEDRRGPLTPAKKIKRTLVLLRQGERRLEERRLGSERIIVKPEQIEIASMYEHALALYRKGDFDAAEMGFDHVLTLKPGDGPSRLMKSRIAKYRTEYAGDESHFDPVYKFDEK
jgi:adenylate cyclase